MDWEALREPDRLDGLGRPEQPIALLFNFAQHRTQTGTTATWAGPVDVLHDPRYAGLLTLDGQE